MPAKRKRRSDRNHAIYEIRCTATKQVYIGITVIRGRAVKKSIRKRWVQHLYDARGRKEVAFKHALHRAIARHGEESFVHRVLTVVRGKEEAHLIELKMIRRRKPALNVEGTASKRKATKRVYR